MTPAQGDALIEILKGMRGDANINANRLAAELVNLTQELFLSRKVAELMLSEAGRLELAKLDRPAAPSPDLAHQEQAYQATQAEVDEINRALLQGDLQLGVNGVPVLGLGSR